MHRIFFVRPHFLPHLHRAHGFEPFVLISVGSIFRPFLRAFDRLGTPGGHAAKPRRLVGNKENKHGLKIYEKRVTRGHDIIADGWTGAYNPHQYPLPPHAHSDKQTS